VIALFSGCATALESRESVSVSAYVFYTPILCVLYVNMYMYIQHHHIHILHPSLERGVRPALTPRWARLSRY
jgi:hypothetical protein